MAKKYIVELTLEEREHLLELISKNKANRAKIVNAYILLKADIGTDGEGHCEMAIYNGKR